MLRKTKYRLLFVIMLFLFKVSVIYAQGKLATLPKGGLPVVQEGFVLGPTISLQAGFLHFQSSSAGYLFAGAKISFNCPLLQIKGGKDRPQLSFIRTVEQGSNKATIQIIDFSHLYLYEINENFYAGAGPGIGFLSWQQNGNTEKTGCFQVPILFNYNIGHLSLSLEGKYQWSLKKSLSFDNTSAGISVGYNF